MNEPSKNPRDTDTRLGTRELRQVVNLYEQSGRGIEQLAIINAFGRFLARTLELPQIYAELALTVGRLLPDIATLFISLYDADTQQLTCAYGMQDGETLDSTLFPSTPLNPLGSGTQSRVLHSKQPLILNDLQTHLNPSEIKPDERITQSGVYAPMLAEEEVVGLIQVQSYTANRFNDLDAEVLATIANMGAIAIRTVNAFGALRHTNAELTRMASELRQLIDDAGAPIFSIDPQGKIVEWNQAVEQITGFKRDDVVGKDLLETFIPAGERVVISAVLRAALLGQKSDNLEMPLITRSRETATLLVNFSARRDREGNINGAIGAGQDITQRKRAEQERLENQRLHAELEQERIFRDHKSRLISTFSHDFRNPLTIIATANDLLTHYSHKMDDQKRQKYFDNITMGVKRLAELTEDISTLNKAETGELMLETTHFDLQALCTAAADDITATFLRPITLEFSGFCPQVNMDARLIRRGLVNLLSNAAKYSPVEKLITLKLSCDKGLVVISVTDEGIGIPEADRRRIFEAFYRASNIGSTTGTGLGLTIVDMVVRMHGGAVEVESAIGAGSTFTLRLPLSPGIR